MSSYGIKVSRPGYDVLSASDENLITSSEFNSPKVVKIIYFSGADTTAHGLGYVPMFDYYTEYDTGKWKLNAPGFYDAFTTLEVEVDDTNITTYQKTYVILYAKALNE